MDIETLADRTPKTIASLNVKALSKSVLPQNEEASHCVRISPVPSPRFVHKAIVLNPPEK